MSSKYNYRTRTFITQGTNTWEGHVSNVILMFYWENMSCMKCKDNLNLVIRCVGWDLIFFYFESKRPVSKTKRIWWKTLHSYQIVLVYKTNALFFLLPRTRATNVFFYKIQFTFFFPMFSSNIGPYKTHERKFSGICDARVYILNTRDGRNE